MYYLAPVYTARVHSSLGQVADEWRRPVPLCNATTGSMPGRSLGTKRAKFSQSENTLLIGENPESLTKNLLRYKNA